MVKIPKKSSWCSHCITEKKTPCEHHMKGDYKGIDVYKPSEWVLSVIGSIYSAYDVENSKTRDWECFGYDPRHGFWMRTIDDLGPVRETNISERAIDRTWHKRNINRA